MALATWGDAFREFAWVYGAANRDRAWLLHDNDVWLANPHYRGPAVRHPEDHDEEEGADMVAAPYEPDYDDCPF